jgi:hypothetical protein
MSNIAKSQQPTVDEVSLCGWYMMMVALMRAMISGDYSRRFQFSSITQASKFVCRPPNRANLHTAYVHHLLLSACQCITNKRLCCSLKQ